MRLSRRDRRRRDYERLRDQITAREAELAALDTPSGAPPPGSDGGRPQRSVMRMRSSMMADEYVENKRQELKEWRARMAQMEARHPELVPPTVQATQSNPPESSGSPSIQTVEPPTERPALVQPPAANELRVVPNPEDAVPLFPLEKPAQALEADREAAAAFEQAHADPQVLITNPTEAKPSLGREYANGQATSITADPTEETASSHLAPDAADDHAVDETQTAAEQPEGEIPETDIDEAPLAEEEPVDMVAEAAEDAQAELQADAEVEEAVEDLGELPPSDDAESPVLADAADEAPAVSDLEPDSEEPRPELAAIVDAAPTPPSDAVEDLRSSPLGAEPAAAPLPQRPATIDDASFIDRAETQAGQTHPTRSTRSPIDRALDSVMTFRVSGPRREYVEIVQQIERREAELARLRERQRARAEESTDVGAIELSVRYMRGSLATDELRDKEREIEGLKERSAVILAMFPQFASMPLSLDRELGAQSGPGKRLLVGAVAVLVVAAVVIGLVLKMR